MKRTNRLTKQDVSKIFKKARRALRHPGLDILCHPTSKPTGRILVVTSRKTGGAPQRNLIRRRIKAIFHENQLFNRGFDVIVIIKKPGINLDFKKLTDLLLKALKKMEQC
ncbi:ribonuclease P protein component [bacterium]|nr:ribonuclease P protein component [bacterium]